MKGRWTKERIDGRKEGFFYFCFSAVLFSYLRTILLYPVDLDLEPDLDLDSVFSSLLLAYCRSLLAHSLTYSRTHLLTHSLTYSLLTNSVLTHPHPLPLTPHPPTPYSSLLTPHPHTHIPTHLPTNPSSHQTNQTQKQRIKI